MTPGASAAELKRSAVRVERLMDAAAVAPAEGEGDVRIRLEALLRRGMDIVGAVLLLLALSPLFVFCAGLVRLSSSGPVFYGSERWGRGGRRFKMWKFRTMVVEAESVLKRDSTLQSRFQGEQKLKCDPRTTAVGRFLRRFSLDELPQVWNVLAGEMSLVGPRPKLIEEAERYGPAIFPVLSVPPGITGLWQISGRNDTTYDERIQLDLKYVERRNLGLDVKILFKTFATVLSGRGAY